MRRVLLSTVFVSALSLSAAIAQEEADQAPQRTAALSGTAQDAAFAGGAMQAEQVTVTATRLKQRVNEVPATVSVITDEEIENNLATDIKDLVRFEPGVSVRSSPSRFTAALSATGRDGNSGFNIRGLEGNRVLIQIDGIRMPDSFSFGAQAVGRGDYLDLDLLKSVEILRGPASALYGSDGLAGAVSFVTKDPDDLLADDESLMARLRVAYSSADDSWSEGAAVAGRSGDWQALLVYARRDGHEQENRGDNEAPNTTRTAPNPTDYESNSALAKLVLAPAGAHRFRLTYEHYDRDVTTEVLSARGVPPLGSTSTLDLDALDETERDRVSVDHTYEGTDGGFIDRAFWAAYYQDSTTRQFTAEDRNTAADRERDSTFDNRVWGLTGQAETSFATGAVEHRLVFGGDYSKTRQEGIRDGVVPPAGESFPTRAFPNTDYVLAGLFVQDEIALIDDTLLIYPALRFDYYELEPQADAFFPLPAAGQDDSHLSPKFGVVWWATDNFGLFGNYAQGFKAPAPSQVNNGFANPIVNYVSLANPDLGPETSNSYEAGIRFRNIDFAGGTLFASATAFTAEYEDFIEQIQVSGSFTPSDPAVFQFVNLGEVEISGAEGRVEARWENGLGFIAAASYARGDQTTAGVKAPLASIDPWKFVAGLVYDDPEGRFGGQVIVTHAAEKDSDRTGGTCAPSCFTPPAFTILDVTAYWNVTEEATLRAGVFNVTDEKYWWWSDVRGLGATSIVTDAYTQPGLNFGASITFRL